jgi:hypothetical protein
MTMNLTRGGLTPATITNLKTQEAVRFMFNPYEFTISKSNTWQPKPVVGQNVPFVTFQQGSAQTLSLTLHFDSLAQNQDVRAHTAPLWKMMLIDEQSVNTQTGKGEPPPVAFAWGPLYFKAVITSMSEKFTLFSAAGVPLRCTIQISLQQYVDETQPAPQMPQAGAGADVSTSITLTQADRLDQVAANSSGSSSNYRQVAEANNIDNPLRVPSGTQVRV